MGLEDCRPGVRKGVSVRVEKETQEGQSASVRRVAARSLRGSKLVGKGRQSSA